MAKKSKSQRVSGLKAIARVHLKQNQGVALPDEQYINKVVNVSADMETALNGVVYGDEDRQQVIRELRHDLGVSVEMGTILEANDFKPWVDEAESHGRIQWKRWNCYMRWLEESSTMNSVSKNVLMKTSKKITELLGNPLETGTWHRRGLVLGDVQSGKTRNYLAVLNRAADVGYKILIVLAGNTESLRKQTQDRINEGLVGKDNRGDYTGTHHALRYLGVGTLDYESTKAISSLTTPEMDFVKIVNSAQVAGFRPSDRAENIYVFVVKKNKAVLEALETWLKGSPEELTLPVLVVDDESDYASVNTSKEEEDPTTINRLIRRILGISTRSTYLAITATPFANIFIDHEASARLNETDMSESPDLFPKDYLYALKRPSSHMGPEEFFGSLDFVKDEFLSFDDDAESVLPIKHKRSFKVSSLPESLLDALDEYIIDTAVYDRRKGAEEPTSMLINVSRFRDVQSQIADHVYERFQAIKNEVDLHSYSDSGVIYWPRLHKRFQLIWRRSIREELNEPLAPDFPTWEEVCQRLPHVLAQIDVVLYNQESKSWNEEHNGLGTASTRQIAIGGDMLSRGITLPTLMVSYFYRRVAASDTLLQMGRWFGYRVGYRDLVHVWVPTQTADEYRYIVSAMEELRAEVQQMNERSLTPSDFGLAVRKHPASLLITARNKMRSSGDLTGDMSLAGRVIETTRLIKDHGIRLSNLRSVNQLRERLLSEAPQILGSSKSLGKFVRYPAVSRRIVIGLLEKYQAPVLDRFFGPLLERPAILSYAENTNMDWDIVLVNGPGSSGVHSAQNSLAPIRRTVTYSPDDETLLIGGDKRRLAGSGDVAALLRSMGKMEEDENKISAASQPKLTENKLYRLFERPVLMVYLVMPELAQFEVSPSHTSNRDIYAALKVLIPGDPVSGRTGTSDVHYAINKVKLQSLTDNYEGSSSDV